MYATNVIGFLAENRDGGEFFKLFFSLYLAFHWIFIQSGAHNKFMAWDFSYKEMFNVYSFKFMKQYNIGQSQIRKELQVKSLPKKKSNIHKTNDNPTVTKNSTCILATNVYKCQYHTRCTWYRKMYLLLFVQLFNEKCWPYYSCRIFGGESV